MKPNFALSLSFEGIRLLHRAAGGWRVVGDVPLDAPELGEELTKLREAAAELEAGSLRCKLIIPNAQIKYLTADTIGLSTGSRRRAAEVALQGATPYAVNDLVFDISSEGPKTHVAAVARETLAEAEEFAQEHGFSPVSFVAIPGDEAYLGEPFFGQTSAADKLLEDGETVDPDGIAVVVVGDASTVDSDDAPTVEEPVADEQIDEDETSEAASDADAASVEVPQTVQDASDQDDPDADSAPDLIDADPVEAKQAEIDPSDVSETSDKPDVATTPEEVEQAADTAQEADAGSEDADAPADSASEPDLPNPPEKDLKPPVIAPITQTTGATPSAGFASRRKEPPVVARPLEGAQRVSDAAAEPITAAKAPDPAPKAPSPKPVVAPIAPDSSSLTSPEVAAPPAKAKSGFLSRRKPGKVGPPKKNTVEGPKVAAPKSEAERMTIFGARKKLDIGGKPRFLGLIMTVVLLVFLAGVAAWASVFMDDGLARFFGDRNGRATASATPDVDLPTLPDETDADTGVRTASLDAGLTEEDGAVLDALRDPVVDPIPELSREEIEANYAVTGIWPVAPEVPEPAAPSSLDDLYLTSIDPVSPANDAVALPPLESLQNDVTLAARVSPAAAGTQFVLDARGLVVPTANGTLSPEGFTVFLGKPPRVPPAIPTRFATTPEADAEREGLAGLRPRLRPQDLSETTERAQLDGLTKNELAEFRPKLRPKSVQEMAQEAAKEAEEDKPEDVAEDTPPAPPPAFENATRFAAAQSRRPDTRPRNFARVVKRAQRNAARQQATRQQAETRTASAATVAPRTVKPKIPSKTSVAKQATVKNAINLRKVNLIGVYGKPSRRRALVRLSNGRYKKVVVGDRIDGGRVSAIGDSELRYVKRGRNVILKMPRG